MVKPFLATGLGIAMLLVLTLAVQKRDLRASYEAAVQRSTYPHLGLYVPSVSTNTVAGDTVTLGTSEGPGRQVLYFFTVSCPYCRASLPAIAKIHEEIGGASQFVAVSLSPSDSTQAYQASYGIRYPVVVLDSADRRNRSLFRARNVPTVLVVDEAGLIHLARVGVVDSRAAADSIVEAALNSQPVR